MINALAQELNDQIEKGNPCLLRLLSEFGKALYYPKGILTQTAEAKEKVMKLIPWTVNDRNAMEKLRNMGVDGIITDYPNLFQP